MSTLKWQREVEALVGPFGWYCVRSKKHLIFRNDKGSQVVVSSSPSDRRRALLNAKTIFRHYGCPF